MKKKILAAVVALCAALVLITPTVQAVGTVYFSAVNDTLMPLNDQTIPKFYGGEPYLPYTMFTYSDTGIGVYCVASIDQNRILLYTGEKRLKFDVSRSEIFDQDNKQYFYSPRVANGTVYLPSQLVCSFFGLTLTTITAEPASIIRIKNASAVFNDPTFAGSNRDNMQAAYNAYLGITPSNEPSAAPSASATVGQTYENVTVFLSFSDLADGQLGLLLDILDTSDYKCGFFVAADEIAENPDLIRRAAGSGHTIGLWLQTGSYDEYQAASDLLFEAAKIKTLFVSADADTIQAAEATAESRGLIFWASNTCDETSEITMSDIAARLSTQYRSRENLSFTCSEKITTVIPMLLSYLADNKFNVQRIKETSEPPASAE